MELKDDGIKDGHVSPVGFNRTFMELKEYSWVYRLRTRTFQSHLYGIERSLSLIIWHRMLVFQSHLYGIERNFKNKASLMQEWFQSHLYGIERRQIAFYNMQNEYVSIAPLWN